MTTPLGDLFRPPSPFIRSSLLLRPSGACEVIPAAQQSRFRAREKGYFSGEAACHASARRYRQARSRAKHPQGAEYSNRVRVQKFGEAAFATESFERGEHRGGARRLWR